ncbi:MAG: B12-binding domain-containing radical SAM protein [Syntrophaceae bacterium]|nr:B12-binding domain-containing radical SAM protein [Syntrophaceae bacterium]
MEQAEDRNERSLLRTPNSELRTKKLKRVLLIFPRERGIKFSNDTLYPFPILGLTLLAALFPKTYEVKILNEVIEEVDFDAEVDLVGITGLTCVIKRAYEIADRFRERGVKVMLGGVHPSLLPEEAKEHADSVFIGEAEGMLHKVIADFESGDLKPFYKNREWSDLKGMPLPRRDLLNKRYRPFFKVIETTRGCPNRCEFCSVPIINGKRYRLRPLEEIDQELSTIIHKKGEYLFLSDDNVTARQDYAFGLFEIFKRHSVKWMGFTTIQIATNEKLLEKARESGCISLFIGFESLLQENLDNVSKRFVDTKELSNLVKTIQSHRIGIQGAFIFGFDGDDPTIFKKTVEFVQKNNIDLPTFSVLTPFPGTPLFYRLEREESIFDRNWSHYDMSHVVFKPKKMTVQELQEGYLWAQKYICAPRSILKRLLWGPKHHFFHFLMSNFVLRGAQMAVIRRIRKEEMPKPPITKLQSSNNQQGYKDQ